MAVRASALLLETVPPQKAKFSNKINNSLSFDNISYSYDKLFQSKHCLNNAKRNKLVAAPLHS